MDPGTDSKSWSCCSGSSGVETKSVVTVSLADDEESPYIRMASVNAEKPLSIGDQVYYAAGRLQLENGDQLDFGTAGKVVRVHSGAQTNGSDKLTWRLSHTTKTPEFRAYTIFGVNIDKRKGANPGADGDVDFVEVKLEGNVGNDDPVLFRPNELSRTRPVMPANWAVGDPVFYQGSEKRLSETDVLTPGLQGEVVGRAARRGDGKDDERVSVRFSRHERNTPISTTSIVKQVLQDAGVPTWQTVRLADKPDDVADQPDAVRRSPSYVLRLHEPIHPPMPVIAPTQPLSRPSCV